MRYRILLAVALVSVAVMAVPGQQEPAPAKTTPQAPASATSTNPFGLTPADKERKNPVEFTADSVKKGKALFASQCAMCHGVTGDGKGDLAVAMHLKLTDFTQASALKGYTDGELFKIISHGNGVMPGQANRLADNHIWEIVSFLRAAGGAVPSKSAAHGGERKSRK